jgi:hypothetical protein
MTPPIWPARIRASRLALGVVPAIRTISFCPICWARVGAALAGVADGVALGAGAGEVGLGAGGTFVGAAVANGVADDSSL